MNKHEIYYGEHKNIISNISHLRDVEISILNYILDSVDNFNNTIPKLRVEYFTFTPTRRVFNSFCQIKKLNDEISEEFLKTIKKKYMHLFTKNKKDLYEDLNLSNAVYIFNSKKSDNIELDLFELEEFYEAKNQVFEKENCSLFNVIINSFDAKTTATYKDNRLIEISTNNLTDLSYEIEDTFKNTMNNLFLYFNQEDSLLEVLIDEKTNIPNGFSLKKGIKELEKLERLSDWLTEFNLLDDISFRTFNLKRVPLIKLPKKNITYIPKEIDIFENLNLLDLTHNKLTTIPYELSNLKKLTMLGLCNNHIEIIPNFLYKMNQLELLCLHGNGFLQIEEDIINLENLKILTLSKNKIKELPNNLSKLTKLEDLDIENNPNLESIDTVILKLPNLINLCVDDRFLPFIVKNKTIFSKINSINLKYSSYKSDDILIKSLDFKIIDDDWQEEENEKYFGAVVLCFNETVEELI